MTTPAIKYLTSWDACSCPGFFYRGRIEGFLCKHIIRLREAYDFIEAQDIFNDRMKGRRVNGS